MWILVNGEYWKNVSGEDGDRLIESNIINDIVEPVKKARKPRAKKVKA